MTEVKQLVRANELHGTIVKKGPVKTTDDIQQIKDKQKKVEFLMHMFLADERTFLIDPSGPTADQDAAAKRRFEQNELHKETAEIAALRAKLEQMTAAGEKAAVAKP